MNKNIDLYSLLFAVAVLSYLLYRTYQLVLSAQSIKVFLRDYYQREGYSNIEISELNTTERLKYGVPVISIFRFYSYYFGVFSSQIEYVRKVELVDKAENDYIIYVELIVKKKSVIQIKEFDSYKF
ncbi:hypothetical protein [Marinifilum fragile]|uniref:hypothetical protein n=1 Tax=Marinifilum fragile TaxID=570161 RepID=UPI0006D2421D|nr:hypothetical protein [Marinifilum fragile]